MNYLRLLPFLLLFPGLPEAVHAQDNAPAEETATGEKRVFGYIEPVLLDPEHGFRLDAKLDTGADHSSLDARSIRRVRRGERHYVRFSVKDPETGESVELLKPFLRRVRIKRHSGETQLRFVVRMTVCLGDMARTIEVNLVDRQRFEYAMLLGRSALEGFALVDPSRQRTRVPTCWREGEMTAATGQGIPERDHGHEAVAGRFAARTEAS